LSSGLAGLDAKIKKEIEANEGGSMWRDRKVRHLDCITPKKEVWPETCGTRSTQI
jgi:hypothetical protein